MKKRHFLKLPEFPGGNKEFQQYVAENLKYPEEARTHQIEGVVHLEAVVDDTGRVSSAQVIKGIGYGCDEEALRLITGARFGGVNNKGVRVRSTRKFRVEFSLRLLQQSNDLESTAPVLEKPVQSIVYTVVPTDQKKDRPGRIHYTIDL